jgi:hypothetical protein
MPTGTTELYVNETYVLCILMIQLRFYDLFLFPVRHLSAQDDWVRDKAIRVMREKNNLRKNSCRFLPIDTEITY